MVETILKSSRFLVLVAVLASAVSAALLYIGSLNIVAHTVIEFSQNLPRTPDQGKLLAVKLLKLLDLVLIGITLHLIAVSLYRLFITPEKVEDSVFLNALHISSFHDLKVTLMQVAVVIMVILFLEHTVEQGASIESLYFGAGIALVIAAATLAWRSTPPSP